VDGIFQLGFIHHIGVAGKTVFILELLIGASRISEKKQGYNERLDEDIPGNVHAFEKTPWR
jgi:hypothetical protein